MNYVHLGMSPERLYKLSQYFSYISKRSPTRWRLFREVNSLPFKIINVRADIWNQSVRLKPRYFNVGTTGVYADRYRLHAKLFEEIDRFLWESNIILFKALSRQSEEDREFVNSFMQVVGVGPASSQIHHQGEQLIWRINSFIVGKAKPKKATIRFLSEKCKPVVEQIITALNEKSKFNDKGAS